ncbi:alpha/beta hydrolase [Nocardia yunnanensis]|uniref:alpha/beta hydrolase n=1 Tax=Nocardia yunnanensis TaxID=2382165 RepID=UPI001FEA40A5|nr:alpha/beta hydrolase family protein [Nocardia yunnanensis]
MVTAVTLVVPVAPAVAAPPDPVTSTATLAATPLSEDGSAITAFEVHDARNLTLHVRSAAMNSEIQVEVQRPADASRPRPVLYLLNGAGGGQDTATWKRNTDSAQFFGDKNVNVVMPIGGAFTYYTDWRAPDPKLGQPMWKTFLTEELPPLIDAALDTTGIHAIAGMSMSGTSVLQLAIARPGLYRSVAAYSGCAQISDPIGQKFADVVVGIGGGNPVNMYGPSDDPEWAANDPYVHAEDLRGMGIYVSNGSGLPGRHDNVADVRTLGPADGGLPQQLLVGGILEAASDWCARNLKTKLHDLDIPATFDIAKPGTHSWGYWQDALRASWPILAKGMDLPDHD